MKREEIITNSKQVVELQTMEFIITIVQSYFNVAEDYYLRRSRKYEIVLPRQIAMYLIRKYTNKISLNDIGKKFGGKNHATILNGVKRIKNYMDVDKELKNQVADIEKIVKFKNKAVTENMDLNKDYYFIDLNNFISMKVLGDKSIILTGFTDDEVSDFSQKIKALIETKQHDNMGMYILEKRDSNGEEK